MYLILIETSGNQAFIFATNKLQENVGASELTACAGTQFVLNALAEVTDRSTLCSDNSQQLRANLSNVRLNPPLEQPPDAKVEVILATSGKALLLASDREVARKIVHRVTRRALEEAPGLDIHGVICEFDFITKPLHVVIKDAHAELEQVKSRVAGPAQRFQRLPVVADCATSGLPATLYDYKAPDERKERSAVSWKKREAATAGLERMRKLADRLAGIQLPRTIEDLERAQRKAQGEQTMADLDWLAVVHCDANGLGQIFLNFHKVIGETRPEDNRAYIEELRKFSTAIDECTEQAFKSALEEARRHQGKWKFLPLIPLVLGGDDVTVVCEGRLALPFSVAFLRAFEEQTAQSEVVARVLAKPYPDSRRVSSCAGVAIMKPHFPFHVAYELAGDLIDSAKKKAKADDKAWPYSALDYHVLYDASGADLEAIRARLTVDGGTTKLVARPYAVTLKEHLPPAGKGQPHLDKLWSDVEAIQARDDDGRRLLPNTMLHDLREGLFLGNEAAQARFELVRDRYREAGIEQLLIGDKLFGKDQDEERTGLLDAMELVDFWRNPEKDKP